MANRLGSETSPYLLQHADNPVDWYPWCDEAFETARAAGKPVLLSVGYSACHWCHVMAHESFEDAATAALMNQLFVNIKVDREERPDVDRIYQTAQQLLTQRSGGWPLTMFLDPEDRRPFFGGTYFPKDARYGMPAFGEVLSSVANYYRERRDEVRAQGDRLIDVFAELDPPAADRSTPLGETPLSKLRERLEATFDRDHGGFGSAPKFPHPATLDRCLRIWRATANSSEPDLDALFMASLTLKRMAEGGLFDHLGGGFYRYSVDRYWQIPHFEKMLYDNGPLLALYADAHLATGERLFADAANATANWMLEDMRSPEGGFYATRDADSEGEEGLYYLWSPETVAEILDADDYPLFAERFGLDAAPNFEGQWHLSVRKSYEAIANAGDRQVAEVHERITAAGSRLLAARGNRIEPGRDEKQLTSWNALAIRALSKAGLALGRETLIEAAATAAGFVARELYVDGRLKASYKDGRARFDAYLDDYAFMIDALLSLLEAHWDSKNLHFAIELANTLLDRFEDPDHGGFHFTARDHETLIHRPKPLADEAMPSGNGVAAFALQRLGFLLGENRYLDAAERTLRFAWRALEDYPHGHVTLLTALEEYLDHPEIIVIRGEPNEIAGWRQAAARLYAPRRMLFAIDASAQDLPGALAERRAVDGETLAYRCVGTHCDLPVKGFEAFTAALKAEP